MTGNNAKIQYGIESDYATIPVAFTDQFDVFSISIEENRDKKAIGSLTGGRNNGSVMTMSIKCEGNMSVPGRPDYVGRLLGATLGVEAAPVLASGATLAYEHVFTEIAGGDSSNLKSFSIGIDKSVDVWTYAGVKVNSLSFSGNVGDLLKLDVDFIGKTEGMGGTMQALSYSPIRPLRLSEARVKLDGNYIPCTSIKLEINNNLSYEQTTETGLFISEPKHGERNITATFDLEYNSNTHALRQDFYKTDDFFALEFTFTTDSEIETGHPYSLKISLPQCQIANKMGFNVTGPEKIKGSLVCNAIEGGSEVITATLTSARATKYI